MLVFGEKKLLTVTTSIPLKITSLFCLFGVTWNPNLLCETQTCSKISLGVWYFLSQILWSRQMWRKTETEDSNFQHCFQFIVFYVAVWFIVIRSGNICWNGKLLQFLDWNSCFASLYVVGRCTFMYFRNFCTQVAWMCGVCGISEL